MRKKEGRTRRAGENGGIKMEMGGGGTGDEAAVVVRGGATFAYPTDCGTTEATGSDCCWHRDARLDWKESVGTMAMT